MAASALTTGNAFTITYHQGDRRMDTGLTDRLKYINLKIVTASGMYPLAGLTLPGYQSVGLTARLNKYQMNPILVASGNAGTAVSGALHLTLSATGKKLIVNRVAKASQVTVGAAITALATTQKVKSQTLYLTAIGW